MSDIANRRALPASVHDGAAIAAIICAFAFAPLGIILGLAHCGAARRAGRAPSGLAVAGAVVGWVITAIIAVMAIMMIAPVPPAVILIIPAGAVAVIAIARKR